MMEPPAIEVASLSFSYRRKAPVLSDFSERFEHGELVALTGVSGRGKSTLLYLLGLMVRPQGGRIYIQGVDTSDLRDRSRSILRANVFGFVFQDAVLDTSRSILDNVVEPALYRHQPRSQAVEEAFSLMERFGVDLDPARKPGQISGGQAQRIALCRALLSRPTILLADEPTGNLDRVTASVVVEALRSVSSEGGTVVVASHDEAVVSQCDRVVRL